MDESSLSTMPNIGAVNPSGSRQKLLENRPRRLRFSLGEDAAGPSVVGPDPHETGNYDTITEDGSDVDDDSADEEILRPNLKFQAGVSRAQAMESMLDSFFSQDYPGAGRSHRKRPQFPGVSETDTFRGREYPTSARGLPKIYTKISDKLTGEGIPGEKIEPEEQYTWSGKKLHCGWKPIHIAAWNGNLRLVKAYVERGADVDAREDDGWTPLMYAADSIRLEACRLLLDLGADINATDSQGRTALFCACSAGSIDIVQLFLEQGADVSKRGTRYCATALLSATYEGHKEIIQLLLEYGADVNDLGEYMWTPLHITVQSDRALTLDVARLLIQEGAEIDAVGTNGVTPLYLAVQARRPDVVELLLVEGAKNLEQKTVSGMTALLRAIHFSSPDIVDLLLRYGARTDLLDSYGLSVVHAAADQSNVDIMKRILETGADFDLESTDGRNTRPIHVASSNDNEEIALLLLDMGAKL